MNDPCSSMHPDIESFLTDLQQRRGASPHTLTSYRLDLEHLVGWLGEHDITMWSSIDRSAARAWVAWMYREGYAPASIARALSALRTFFRFLVREGRLAKSPLSLIPAPKNRKALPNVLSVDEIERLLAAPDTTTPFGLRDRAMLELMYATGL